MFWPCETRTSTCRSFATISSGLYRFLAIAVLLDVKDIPQVGPLQWGWISGERLLANFATQQVIKRLGLRLYPYHLVVRSTLRTGQAGGIVMHRYQARSGSSHHLPLSCSSALS